MRISDWSSDVCSSDLRGRQRLLDVEQRAEIHEDRRPKPEFLRARAERDLEFGMAQIISLAPQRVVVNPILVGDERLVAVGVGGVRDTLPARPHAADVAAAALRFAEITAIADAALCAAGAESILAPGEVAAS